MKVNKWHYTGFPAPCKPTGRKKLQFGYRIAPGGKKPDPAAPGPVCVSLDDLQMPLRVEADGDDLVVGLGRDVVDA